MVIGFDICLCYTPTCIYLQTQSVTFLTVIIWEAQKILTIDHCPDEYSSEARLYLVTLFCGKYTYMIDCVYYIFITIQSDTKSLGWMTLHYSFVVFPLREWLNITLIFLDKFKFLTFRYPLGAAKFFRLECELRFLS